MKGESTSVWIAELEVPAGWVPEAVFISKRRAIAWQKEHPFRWTYRVRKYVPAPTRKAKRR